MRNLPVGVLCLSVLAGCAGSQGQYRLLEKDGAIRVDPGQPPAYDYVVSLRNVKDFGYNADDKGNRDETALRLLRTQCPAGKVVGETVINTGTFALGNPSRTYAVRVKCNPT